MINSSPESRSAPAPGRPLWLEFVVPAIMALGCAVSLWDALRLSIMAMVFPVALIAVVIASLCWALVAALRRGGPSQAEIDEDDPGLGPVFAWAPWLLAIVPLLAIVALELAGGLLVLIAIVIVAQFIFDRSRPVLALLLALVVTLPVYGLFKYVLYVRFPSGLFGLG